MAWSLLTLAIVIATVGLLWRAWRPGPRIEIDGRGIRDRRLGREWIPWDAVEGAFPPTLADSQGVLLRLRPGPGLARALARGSNGARGEPGPPGVLELRLDLADTALSPVEVLQEILEHLPGPPSGADPDGAAQKSPPT